MSDGEWNDDCQADDLGGQQHPQQRQPSTRDPAEEIAHAPRHGCAERQNH